MNFEEHSATRKLGAAIGFVLGYFLFTTVLYYILIFLGRLPSSWNYLSMMLLTVCILILGLTIKGLLR